MRRRRVFCVEAFWRAGLELRQASLQQYESGSEAEEVALDLSHKRAGVALYQLEGDAEAGVWSEPELLAVYGEVPEAA